MKKSDYIYNLLLKENDLSAKLKRIIGGFTTLNKNVESLNQTMSTFSTDVAGNLGKVNSEVSKTADNVKKGFNFSDLVAFGNSMKNVSDGFKTLSSYGTTFEQNMANLSVTTGITGKDLDELNRIARESGVATGAGAAEAANAFTQLASKVKVSKVGLEGLKTLQQETVTLSKAGGIGMTDAASALAETVSQFGLGADQANRVVNILAAGSQSGSAGIAELAASLGTTGAAAAATGISVEQAAGALEVLSMNNQKGAEAGTALSGILTAMQSNLNMDLSQTGLSTALESLTPLLGNTTELSRIFGEANVGTAQYLIQNATSVGEMTTALTDTNVAQEQAAIRSDTMAEKIQQVQATIDNYKISLFEATDGMSAYAGVVGDNLVLISQLSPLIAGVGKSLIYLGTNVLTLTNLKKAWNVVTNLSAKAFKLLKLAFVGSPFGLIAVAIGGVVTVLTICYNKFDNFRKIVDKTVDSVKSFFGITSKSKQTTEETAEATEELAATTDHVTQATEEGIKANDASAKATDEATRALLEKNKANKDTAGSTNEIVIANDNLNTSFGDQKKKITANLDTLDGIGQKITELQEKQKTSNTEQAIAIGKEINLLKEKKKAMENAIIIGSAEPSTGLLDIPTTIPLVNAPKPKSAKDEAQNKIGDKVPSMGDFGKEIDSNTKKVGSFTESIWGSNSVIGQWANNATSGVNRITTTIQEFGSMLTDSALNGMQKATGGLQAMGAMMSSMSGMVQGAAGSWLSWGANLLGTIANALPQLLELFGVQCAVAAAGAATSVASIPVVGWIMAGVAVASVIAALATIPKPKAMAQGGIVYGNTFAQVGEYPGAANNPEVVAPLNRLRQLIQPAGSFNGGTVEFVIKGNRLVGVLNKEANKNRYF